MAMLWQIAGKRVVEEEIEAQQWIEAMLGERFTVAYEDALRDGIILCKVMNRLRPGSVTRVNVSGGDIKFMDNIQQFLAAATLYGVPETDLFQSVDLITKKNIANVTMCIYALARTSYKYGWEGPTLGPKPSEQNVRHFSDSTLAKGKEVIGLQAGFNKGASQAGTNPGAPRRIIHGK